MPEMDGWKVLRRALADDGAEELAELLGVHPDTVYKWCRRPSKVDDPKGTGRRNPIDYFLRLVTELYAMNAEGAEIVFDRIDHARAVLRKNYGRMPATSRLEIEEKLRQISREMQEAADAIAEEK